MFLWQFLRSFNPLWLYDLYVTLSFIYSIHFRRILLAIPKHKLLVKKEIWAKRLIVLRLLLKMLKWAFEAFYGFVLLDFLCDNKTDISHIALSRPGQCHIVRLLFLFLFVCWNVHFELYWILDSGYWCWF